MVMRTYFKTIVRSIKGNFAKFISITMIMLLGVAFVAGLGTLTPTIKSSYTDQLNELKYSDIIIKSTSEYGFTAEELAKIQNLDYVETAEIMTAVDMDDNGVSSLFTI